MTTVSVVIRTYTEDRWGYLVEAIESLKHQTHPADEIVIVVDHNPALLRKVQEHFPDTNVVPSEKQGSSGAWNAGIKNASGEIIAFMDDDAEAKADWLEKILQHYSDEKVMGVGGSIEPNWLAKRPGWFPDEFQWVVGCTYKGIPEQTTPVRNLIGCNMSFRQSALQAIGGFQEIKGLGHMGTVPVGCDETELCIRIHQQNPATILLHEPRAIVHHKVPAARARFRYFWRRCYLEGQSKAVVSQLVGMDDGLSTERSYVLKTLPMGVIKGFADLLRGDFNGIQRSGAIIIGFSTTAASYTFGRIRTGIQRRRKS